jgi:hypothetical protein
MLKKFDISVTQMFRAEFDFELGEISFFWSLKELCLVILCQPGEYKWIKQMLM